MTVIKQPASEGRAGGAGATCLARRGGTPVTALSMAGDNVAVVSMRAGLAVRC
jgi:hypothetical protein